MERERESEKERERESEREREKESERERERQRERERDRHRVILQGPSQLRTILEYIIGAKGILLPILPNSVQPKTRIGFRAQFHSLLGLLVSLGA